MNWPPVGFRRAVGETGALFADPAGDDNASGLSAGDPVQTVSRLIQLASFAPSAVVTGTLSAGLFLSPRIFNFMNLINLVGTTTTTVATISVVVVATNAGQLVLDVTGLTETLDSLIGKQGVFGAGAASGRYANIYANDATVLGVTRIYAAQSGNLTLAAPSVGNTLTIATKGTEFRLQADTTYQASTQSTFTDLNITGTTDNNTMFILGSDKPTFSRCYMRGFRRIQVGVGARAHLDTCTVRTKGLSDFGMLASINGGSLLLQSGTVVVADQANLNSDFISTLQGGTMLMRGAIVMRDMTDAIRVEGANFLTDNGVSSEDICLFETRNGTAVSNAGYAMVVNGGALSATGIGGVVVTPNMEGEVQGQHAVYASGGARVRWSGNLDTASVVNAATTDGNSSRAIGSDGAVILGAVPERTQAFGSFEVVSVTGPATVSVQPWGLYVCDASGLITLNASVDAIVGDVIGVKIKTAGFNTTFAGNGNNVENPALLGTYAASVLVNGLGNCVFFTFDGTVWVYTF